MPEPPHVGLFTRYVLENPLPLGFVLLALAAGAAWTALRSERRTRLRAAAVLGAAGAAVLLLGALVVTSGERGRRVTLALVDAAVAGDVGAASACFADDATLAFGRTTNPGFPRDEIEERLRGLAGDYAIRSNRVLTLRSCGETRRRAEVHLACATTLEAGFGPVRTQWVLTVERGAGGAWKITRVTWISIEGRAPSPDLGR